MSSASEQYQHEVASALAVIEGVENISDDIIVHAADQKTHDQHLYAVLKHLHECGLTLNPEKCELNMDCLVFMGILLTKKGIGPTEERIKAIVEAREPENASGGEELSRTCLLQQPFHSIFCNRGRAIKTPNQKGHCLCSVQSKEEHSMRSKMD